MSSEYVLQKAVEGALLALKTRPDAVDDFLPQLALIDPDLLAQARDFFATADVPVRLSYPTQPPPQSSALVAIVLGNDAQQEEYLGSFLGDELEETADADPISLTEYYGVQTRSSYSLIVCSFNADLCVWLSKAIRWVLLAQKDTLHDLGMIQHQIGISDLQPDTRWQPDYVLRRAVSFSCTEVAGFSIGYGTFIKQFIVENDDPATTAPIFIES